MLYKTERILKNSGFSARGSILPADKFEPLFDYGEKKFNDATCQKSVARAEEFLQKEWKILPLSLYREFITKGTRSGYENPYFERRAALIHLAIAEAYERKGRFTDKLADVVWMVLEESNWVIPAHFRRAIGSASGVPNAFNTLDHTICLFGASTAAEMAFVYYLCGDILDGISPYIRQRIKHEIDKRTIRPYLTQDVWWMGATNPTRSNWCPWIASNILFVAAIMCDDMTIREAVIQKAMNSVDTYFECYNKDAGCDEGPGYWSASVGSMFDCLQLLYDLSAGKINVFDNPLIRAMGEYVVDLNISSKNYVNFADASATLSLDGVLLREFGERCSSEVLYDFGNYSLVQKHYGANHTSIYRALRSIYAKPLPKEASVLKAKKSVYYEAIEVALFRKSEVRGDGLFLAMKGGNNGENHSHDDVGCIIVHYENTPVLIDPGSGAYINQAFEKRENSWQKYSDFHNLPIINGKVQARGGQAHAENTVYTENSLSAELKYAYPEDAGIASYVREAIHGGDKIILNEKISLNEEGEVDFVFTSAYEPTVNGASVNLAASRVLTSENGIQPEIEVFHDEITGAIKRWNPETMNLYRIHFKTKTRKDVFTFTIQ